MDRAELEGLPWEDVESSNIARVAFVPEHERHGEQEPTGEGVLYIEFKGSGGRVYSYADVPKHVHENLIAADSVGRYFAHVVKARPDLYRVEKIEVAE